MCNLYRLMNISLSKGIDKNVDFIFGVLFQYGFCVWNDFALYFLAGINSCMLAFLIDSSASILTTGGIYH